MITRTKLDNKMNTKMNKREFIIEEELDIKMYDDVYDKVQNKIGCVYDIKEKFYVIMTAKGLVKCIKENCVSITQI